MKTTSKITILAILVMATLLNIQSIRKTEKIHKSVVVGGACGMCKERIEKAVDLEGVTKFKFSLKTNLLGITYLPSKITWEKIEKSLLAAGHDVGDKKASDSAYYSLDECCRYRSGSKCKH